MRKRRSRASIGLLLWISILAALGSNSLPLHAQTPTPIAPAFDVATIKPSKPDEQPNVLWSPALFHAWHQSVRQLVKIAYNINDDSQLTGGPAWIDREFFDIEAKPEQSQIQAFKRLGASVMMDQSRLMLQSLLEHRFRLRVTGDTRVLPVFALTLAKAKPKLKLVTASPEIAGSPKPPFPPPPPPPTAGATQKLLPPPTGFPRLYKSGANQLTATTYRMSWFCDWLSRQGEIHRPVLDRTGLDGNYDFVLNGIAVFSTAAEPPPPEDSTISLFVALSEQLGLKLEPTKAPLPVLVIDHVEQPSAN